MGWRFCGLIYHLAKKLGPQLVCDVGARDCNVVGESVRGDVCTEECWYGFGISIDGAGVNKVVQICQYPWNRYQ